MHEINTNARDTIQDNNNNNNNNHAHNVLGCTFIYRTVCLYMNAEESA